MAIPVGKKIAFIDISADDDLSNAIDIRDNKFRSLILPTLTSCDITFKVAEKEDGTYVDLCKVDGTIVTVTAGTGDKAIQYIDELAGFSWMKIATSVAQGADREITVCIRE